jgi:peptidoglycan/LPS O-acetylase OafA/YrhL
MVRLKSIDFLRGIAVLLVLFRHHWIGIDSLKLMGGIGVDLFFVLSGFLVSGLLFNERKKYGDTWSGRFLIRRGFKIYPLFYLSISITLLIAAMSGWQDSLNWKGRLISIASELFFFQSYVYGLWPHHWSLAVEEHFYLTLALTFSFLSTRIPKVAPLIFGGCLLLRIIEPNPFYSHLRMDSLFMGVFISYYYHCKREVLESFYRKYRAVLIALCFLPVGLVFTVEYEYFMETIGFTILYVGFGSLLLVFLHEDLLLPSFVSRIGYYSYGIYLFHMYPLRYLLKHEYTLDGPHVLTWDVVESFTAYITLALVFGIGISYLVEKPMLALRDRWFPRRSVSLPMETSTFQ